MPMQGVRIGMNGCGWQNGGLDFWRNCGQGARQLIMRRIGMPDNNRILSDLQVSVVLGELLGSIIHWKTPIFHKNIGPYNPAAFHFFERKLSIALRKERKKVLDFAFKFSGDVFDSDGILRKEVFEIQKVNLQHVANDLSGSRPDWFAGGFGNAEYTADFEYWSVMEKLSLIEAVCLSIGFDPRYYNVNQFNIPMERGYLYSEVPHFFFRRLGQFRRKFDTVDADDAVVEVKDLVDWIEGTGMEIDSGFLPAMRKNSNTHIETENLDQREKTSLLQIILVMAMDCYKFDPKSKRVDMAKEIEERAASNGLKISRETIRNHLKSAGGLLKDDWKND